MYLDELSAGIRFHGLKVTIKRKECVQHLLGKTRYQNLSIKDDKVMPHFLLIFIFKRRYTCICFCLFTTAILRRPLYSETTLSYSKPGSNVTGSMILAMHPFSSGKLLTYLSSLAFLLQYLLLICATVFLLLEAHAWIMVS